MTSSDEVITQRWRESIPVLETERLTLRAPRYGDVEAITPLVNDRRIAENTPRIPYPYGINDAQRFIASVNRQRGEATFVITRHNTLIGACSVDPREGGSKIGWWLGISYCGQGYATEGVRAVVDYAFGALQHETLHADSRVSNPASRGFSRNAASSGSMSACAVSEPLVQRRRSTAFASIADYGRRSSPGAGQICVH